MHAHRRAALHHGRLSADAKEAAREEAAAAAGVGEAGQRSLVRGVQRLDVLGGVAREHGNGGDVRERVVELRELADLEASINLRACESMAVHNFFGKSSNCCSWPGCAGVAATVYAGGARWLQGRTAS